MRSTVHFSGLRRVSAHIVFNGNYASESQTKQRHRKQKVLEDCLHIWMLQKKKKGFNYG